MQFTPENAAKVMTKAKTQTRRAVKDGEFWDIYHQRVISGYPNRQRVKWEVGRIYAIQPGRGKPAIGYAKLLEIRKEKLQDISEEDAQAEGVEKTPSWVGYDGGARTICYRNGYVKLWDSINPRGKRWADNQLVWVLTLEVVS